MNASDETTAHDPNPKSQLRGWRSYMVADHCVFPRSPLLSLIPWLHPFVHLGISYSPTYVRLSSKSLLMFTLKAGNLL